MSKAVCELCGEVYSTTAELPGFYITDEQIEKLETEKNLAEFEGHLYGWFKENSRRMCLCHDCRENDFSPMTVKEILNGKDF